MNDDGLCDEDSWNSCFWILEYMKKMQGAKKEI